MSNIKKELGINPKRSASKKRGTVLGNPKLRNILLVMALLLTVVLVLLFKGCADNRKAMRQLQGCWEYNEYTSYEFDGKGNGRMFYDTNKGFVYTYKVQENVLHLDFEEEYVTDCQYSYKIEGDQLTLIGGEGTAEIGKEYVLTYHDHGEK